MTLRWSVTLTALTAMFAGGVTQASVVMNATRYVYEADAREITVKVSNTGTLPALTQAWIDDGDERSTPERVNVPFNLTPPIARVEAGKSQTLRISHTGGAMPADRESLFWINVLEVPPKPANAEDSSKMQLAFRYRLKLFFRPDGLPGAASTAPEKLSWSRTEGGRLEVTNPTAFHVTLNDVRLDIAGSDGAIEPFAIAPFATMTPELPKSMSLAGGFKVRYQSINDYGGFVTHERTIGKP